MKKIFVVLAILTIVMLMGCTEAFKRKIKDLQSEYSGGLNRVLTVYALSGEVIKTYEGRFDIDADTTGQKIKFDIDGKRVIIYNATVVVEEK
jgi:hypothetical protein